MMEKEFIPYELAVKLKELGFDEPCNNKWFYFPDSDLLIDTPLWQQAFDWFRKEHNLHALNSPLLNQEWSVVIDNTLNAHQVYWDKKPNYEEARLECLKKLIEIVKDEKL